MNPADAARTALRRQLDSVLVRNARARVLEDTPEALLVEVELRYPGWMRPLQRILRLRTSRRYRLDGPGAAFFRAIDGHRAFENHVDDFAAEHGLSFYESRALLMQYLHGLVRRGLVAIGVKSTGGTTPC